MEEKIPEQLSSLDIYYLIKEFGEILEAKVENLYQKDNIIYIHLYKKNKGKKILKIMLPSFIYLTETKEKMPVKPQNFCTIIRKYLKNSILENIEQINFERIIKIKFLKKEQEYNLIIEMFGDGNCILCNKEMKIIYPLTHQKWKDRTIKSGNIYTVPGKRFNILKNRELMDEANKTNMETIVTFLAKDIGFGGIYAEKICKLANIEKTINPKKANLKIIQKVIDNLFNENIKLNKLLEQKLTKQINIEEQNIKFKSENQIKNKKEKILTIQKATVKKQEQQMKEYNQKGDLIYSNYQKINSIINEINQAKRKYSWKYIKTKLKNHSVIKEIDEKNQKITLEINQ
ncbi:MAG: NFACT family protein [Candidatus Woesearchaeota archaeon]